MIHITPIIPCCGSETRLWSLGRAGFPNQFLSLAGKASLFQQAALRLPSAIASFLGDHSQQLLQHRVYDLEALAQDLRVVGLPVAESGGFLAKPFAHGPIEHITQALSGGMLNVLYQPGKDVPEWTSETYAEARKVQP